MLRIANYSKIAAIILLLRYSSNHPSPQSPDVSEWMACDKPLGLWISLWAVKVALDLLSGFWVWGSSFAEELYLCVFLGTFISPCSVLIFI